MADPCFDTHFTAHETIKIRKADSELLKAEYEKDNFASLTLHVMTQTAFARKVSAKEVAKAAQAYAQGYSHFISNFKSAGETGDWESYEIEYRLPSSYEEPDLFAWLSLLYERVDPSTHHVKYRHRTSIGSFIAYDLNDWWSFNQRGLVNKPTDDLESCLTAEFTIGAQSGFISSSDCLLDGRSLED